MSRVKNIITKATLKSDRCEVSYKERFTDENFTNEVSKKCDQIIHEDLRQAFLLLRPFLITITEQPESSFINSDNIDELPDEELEKELSKYFVTGYVRGGSDESAGVSLIGQKMLKSGQVLNLIAPFTKFIDESLEAYPFVEELSQAIDRCDWEVSEYVFNGKYGFKQQQLDFETDIPQEAVLPEAVEEKKPKKKGPGRRQKTDNSVVFDQFA